MGQEQLGDAPPGDGGVHRGQDPGRTHSSPLRRALGTRTSGRYHAGERGAYQLQDQGNTSLLSCMRRLFNPYHETKKSNGTF